MHWTNIRIGNPAKKNLPPNPRPSLKGIASSKNPSRVCKNQLTNAINVSAHLSCQKLKRISMTRHRDFSTSWVGISMCLFRAPDLINMVAFSFWKSFVFRLPWLIVSVCATPQGDSIRPDFPISLSLSHIHTHTKKKKDVKFKSKIPSANRTLHNNKRSRWLFFFN